MPPLKSMSSHLLNTLEFERKIQLKQIKIIPFFTWSKVKIQVVVNNGIYGTVEEQVSSFIEHFRL